MCPLLKTHGTTASWSSWLCDQRVSNSMLSSFSSPVSLWSLFPPWGINFSALLGSVTWTLWLAPGKARVSMGPGRSDQEAELPCLQVLWAGQRPPRAAPSSPGRLDMAVLGHRLGRWWPGLYKGGDCMRHHWGTLAGKQPVFRRPYGHKKCPNL